VPFVAPRVRCEGLRASHLRISARSRMAEQEEAGIEAPVSNDDHTPMVVEEKPSAEVDAAENAAQGHEEQPSTEGIAPETDGHSHEDVAVQGVAPAEEGSLEVEAEKTGGAAGDSGARESHKRELDTAASADDRPPLAKLPRVVAPRMNASSPLAFSTPKSAGPAASSAAMASKMTDWLHTRKSELEEKRDQLKENKQESNAPTNMNEWMEAMKAKVVEMQQQRQRQKESGNPMQHATAKASPSMPAPPAPIRKKGGVPCWFWKNKGYCHRGAACTFVHDEAEETSWNWEQTPSKASNWNWEQTPAKASSWSWEQTPPKAPDPKAPALAAMSQLLSAAASLATASNAVLTDPKLIEYSNKWKLNRASQELLNSLTPSVRQQIMDEFSPRDTSRDVNAVFQKFASGRERYLQERGSTGQAAPAANQAQQPAAAVTNNAALALQQQVAVAIATQIQQHQLQQYQQMVMAAQVQQAMAAQAQMSALQLAQAQQASQAMQTTPQAQQASLGLTPTASQLAPSAVQPQLALPTGNLLGPTSTTALAAQASPAASEVLVGQTPPQESAAIANPVEAEHPPPAEVPAKVYSEAEKKAMCKELRHDLRELGSMTSLQDNKAIPRVAQMAQEKYLPAIGALLFHSSIGDAFEKAKFTSHRKSVIYVLHELLMALRKTKFIEQKEDFFPTCLNALERIGGLIAHLDEKERADYKPLVEFWTKKKVFRPEDALQIKRWWGITAS